MLDYNITYRKKDKGWQFIISYKLNGTWKQKSKQGFKTQKEAKPVANRTLESLKRNVKNNINLNTTDTTFKQFTDTYLEHLSLYRTTNTILSFKTVLNHFLCLNNKPINKISTIDIQEIIDNMTRNKLNPNTIQDYIRKLNTVFKYAKDNYNLINSSPIQNIKFNKSKKDINKRALEKSELNKLLKDFKNSKYYLVLLIASTCGLRLGEILGLTWDDIDEINCTFKINKQWKQLDIKSYGFGSLKSKNSYRVVPIPAATLEELKKHKKVVNINNRLFNFKNTDSTSICINRLLKIRGYDITIHELRHTYATMLISNGIDFKTAASFLGHDIKQTMQTYSHVNNDMIKKATHIIENIF